MNDQIISNETPARLDEFDLFIGGWPVIGKIGEDWLIVRTAEKNRVAIINVADLHQYDVKVLPND